MKENIVLFYFIAIILTFGCKNRPGEAGEANQSRVLGSGSRCLQVDADELKYVPAAKDWTSEKNARDHYEKHGSQFGKITYDHYKQKAIESTYFRGSGFVSVRSKPGVLDKMGRPTAAVINTAREDYFTVTVLNPESQGIVTYYKTKDSFENMLKWIDDLYPEKDFYRDLRGYPYRDHLGRRVKDGGGMMVDLSPPTNSKDVGQPFKTSSTPRKEGFALTAGGTLEGPGDYASQPVGFSLNGGCDLDLADEAKDVGQTSGKDAHSKSMISATKISEEGRALSVEELKAVSESHIREEVNAFTKWLLAKPSVQQVMNNVGRTIVIAVLADAIYQDLKEGNYRIVDGQVVLYNVAHSHVMQTFASLLGAEMGASAGAALGNTVFMGIGGFIGGFIGGVAGWELGGRMETWVANQLLPQAKARVVGERAKNYQVRMMASNVKIFMYPVDRRVYLTPPLQGQGLKWAPASETVVPGWDIYEIVDTNGSSTGLKLIKSHTKGSCLMAYPQSQSLGLTTCDHGRVNQQWTWGVGDQVRNETTIQSVLNSNLCIDRYLNDGNEEMRNVGLYSCDSSKHNQRWTYGG